MTTGEAIKVLQAALIALDAGNIDAARQMIVKVIEWLQIRRHK
jgi:hypothetical protein